MKKQSSSFLIISILLAAIFFSCKKQIDTPAAIGSDQKGSNRPPSANGGGRNQPPVANAGTDQAFPLPSNTINLNGGRSTDPNNNISSYAWTKISGPYKIIRNKQVFL